MTNDEKRDRLRTAILRLIAAEKSLIERHKEMQAAELRFHEAGGEIRQAQLEVLERTKDMPWLLPTDQSYFVLLVDRRAVSIAPKAGTVQVSQLTDLL
jgi:hypothetical protein